MIKTSIFIFIKTFVFLSLLVLSSSDALAEMNEYDLFLFSDSTNSLTINEVRNQQFVFTESNVPNLGVSNSAHWLRVKIGPTSFVIPFSKFKIQTLTVWSLSICWRSNNRRGCSRRGIPLLPTQNKITEFHLPTFSCS